MRVMLGRPRFKASDSFSNLIPVKRLIANLSAECDRQQRLYSSYRRKARNCHPLEAHVFVRKRLIAESRLKALTAAIEALAPTEDDE